MTYEISFKLLDFDYDLQYGFAWITFYDVQLDKSLTVQCCLDIKNGEFIKKINASDCGHDWGICGDVNETAFKKYGEKKCLDYLFRYASKNGITVRGFNYE